MTISMCIVSGIMLDVVTHLINFDMKIFDRQKELRLPNKIDWFAGGTGTNLAIAASLYGFSPVFLISKIGLQADDKPDIAAQLILENLQLNNVRTVLCGDKAITTGTNMITYLNQDTRLLVADNEAEMSFSINDITSQMIEVVSQSDILFISGFLFLNKKSAQATLSLMQEANNQDRIIVLDVVPHQIYKSVSVDEFREYTRLVNVLISEVNTLRHLFPSIQPYKNDDTERIAGHLLECYNVVVLRPSHDLQFLVDRKGFIETETIDFAKIEKSKQQRGFFDQVSMRTLKHHYTRIKSTISGG